MATSGEIDYPAWGTCIGTVGSCLIAAMSCTFARFREWYRRPKLKFELRRFKSVAGGEMEETMAIDESSESYGVWLKVVNVGKSYAQHCRIECEQIYEKIASEESFAEQRPFMALPFVWQSGKDREDVSPSRWSWCRIFDLAKVQTPTDGGTGSENASAKTKTFELFLAIRRGKGIIGGKKMRCKENAFLVPLSIQYDSPLRAEKRYIRIHWTPGESDLNQTNLTYKLLSERQGKKLIRKAKGDVK